MRLIDITALTCEDVAFNRPEVFPESWESRRSFSQYKTVPRPHHGLFFIQTPMEVSFFSKGGQVIRAKKGQVVFIPQGSLYHVLVEGGAADGIDTYTVNFDMTDAGGVPLTLSEQICILCDNGEGLLGMYFQKLSEAAHSGKGQCDLLRLRAEFYALMSAIATSVSLSNGYYAIRDGVEALRSEWNRNEKIERYATLCGVSEAYFYRCFRAWAGKSPIEYRNALRLSNAEAMLRHTDMPIGEIAGVVGFEDPFYFSRVFVGHFGCSPKAYRTSAKEFQSITGGKTDSSPGKTAPGKHNA